VDAALRDIDGVVDVHDLHVWTLTSQMDVVTAHLSIARDAEAARVLDAARRRLALEFQLTHATLQIEAAEDDCAHPDW
jgi:cobalt-zinc-cadmium efflux system protein